MEKVQAFAIHLLTASGAALALAAALGAGLRMPSPARSA
jgi:hypothetical protein